MSSCAVFVCMLFCLVFLLFLSFCGLHKLEDKVERVKSSGLGRELGPWHTPLNVAVFMDLEG